MLLSVFLQYMKATVTDVWQYLEYTVITTCLSIYHLYTNLYKYCFICMWGLSRVTPEVRHCLWIPVWQRRMWLETAAVKSRVKGLQMGVKMETAAKVNPEILALYMVLWCYLWKSWYKIRRLLLWHSPWPGKFHKQAVLIFETNHSPLTRQPLHLWSQVITEAPDRAEGSWDRLSHQTRPVSSSDWPHLSQLHPASTSLTSFNLSSSLQLQSAVK